MLQGFTDFQLNGAVNYAFVILLREPDASRFQILSDTLRAENVEFRRGTAGGGNLRTVLAGDAGDEDCFHMSVAPSMLKIYRLDLIQ